ncbi:protein SDA1 homolog [Coccinella septempunctata]|uniref:protein SDA1 homolog n=1 Tax=Coccinella septempunctata TaxID=41139 RepID=UPI001D063F4A|nr:protein SDA1 homolog [Coccinella septempunctata]
MVRHNNQLENNLPQLQYLIKKDPESYKDDFLNQYRNFQGILSVFCGTPEQPNKKLEDLVMFVAQVVQCYPTELEQFPKQLIDILEKYDTVLDKEMRMQLCRALILLRNKQLLLPNDLLELFFKLLRCDDKNLRDYLRTHIITDIKNLNAKHKNAKLNTSLQNFMFTMLKDNNSRAAKMSVDIMIELYKKNVWNDTKTVNVIATGCFSKITKVMVASLKFFLGKDEDEKSDNSDSDDDVDPKEVMMANKFNKKTRKREKNLAKVKKMAAKAYKKKSKSESFNFSALHLIHDPQGMAEKLFHQLETTTKRFEVKLMTLDVVSRLIGLHQLFLFNFYSYIQRFMQPHQREVTRILQFAAQASHELVPPDVIEPVLKTLANNFITERNSSDVMAIGLNAVKEICSRCPLAMSEDLLQDLAEYKNYRERAVMMASRGLVHLFRNIRPQLLRKKDRGRPTEATEELVDMQYGGVNAADYVKGADVLLRNHKEEVEVNSDSGSDDDEWVDVQHSSDEEMVEAEEDDSDNAEEEEDEAGYEEEDAEDEEDDEESGSDEDTENENKEKPLTKVERKKLKAKRKLQQKVDKVELAKKVTLERILTDEDFKRIDMANIKKQVFSATKGLKRLAEQDVKERSELVKLGDIENIYKKRKHDKATRVESVRKGQEGREPFGYKDGRVNIHCSKTNREKRKNKNFQMMRHKVKAKVKKSFKDKQVALRNHLLKLKKMK